MTTRVTVSTDHVAGPDVAVMVYVNCHGNMQPGVEVPAGENRDFYVHSGQYLVVREHLVRKETDHG